MAKRIQKPTNSAKSTKRKPAATRKAPAKSSAKAHLANGKPTSAKKPRKQKSPVKSVAVLESVQQSANGTTVEELIVSEDFIRVSAYEKWVAAGRPPGCGTNFWLEAEKELLKK
jgi:hypothetical protein